MTQVSVAVFLLSGCILNASSVPVYDTHKSKDGFHETAVNMERLKSIECEVPPGSCVVVAYTINTWGKTKLNVSFNIKWAMLLGVPGPSD